MAAEVDVFISNYILVDPEIYQLWVEGHSATEAVSILNRRGLGQKTGASTELIASDVLDHFRTYSQIEKLIDNPIKLLEPSRLQIDPRTCQFVIEKYYEVDDDVIRELIGRKLTNKFKKDLDEVAERTLKPLKSIRRQFDNVKRIYKAVEDLPGSMIQNIQNLFLLSDNLANRYSCVVFLSCIRFEIKKKTSHSQFSLTCWKKCTETILEHLSKHTTGPEGFDADLEKGFFNELKDVKGLMEKDREHKHMVMMQLKPALLQKCFLDLDMNFKTYSKTILTAAGNLQKVRDVKSLLVDLIGVSDNLKQANWNSQELELFLDSYVQCALEFEILRESASLRNTWERYMKIVTGCLLAMHL